MRNLLLGTVLGFGLAVILLMVLTYPEAQLAPSGISYPYSRFVADVDDGKVEEVTFQGPKIAGRFKDQHVFATLAPHVQVLPALTDKLLANKVTVTARPTEDDPSAASALVAWIPFLISYGFFFGGFWLFMTRPLLALIRQLDAHTKATHHATAEPPAQDSRGEG